QVVVDHRSEPLGVIEKHRITDLKRVGAPGYRWTLIATLQKTVDVVDAVKAVIVQAQDDFILRARLEQRFVEHRRVPVPGHDLGNVIVYSPNLVPEAQQ